MEKVIQSADGDIWFNFQGYAERLLELDELYLSILKVSGFTVEQLLEMFMDGYTMEPPFPARLLSEVLS